MKRIYKKRNKYNNKITGKHASKKESRRAYQLYLMQKNNQISQLKEQVRFIFWQNPSDGRKRIEYVADFTYIDNKQNYIVEDCKGFKTDVYKIKKKLMKWIYNIDIYET